MNTSKDLMRRLLYLLPVAVIKENFSHTKKSQTEIIQEIVGTNSESVITNFAINNFGYTKQHIYLFEAPKKLNAALKHSFLDRAPVSTNSATGGVTIFNYVITQTYDC